MRNKKYLKRFWAIFLTAVLCIGLLQMPGVYASEDETPETVEGIVTEITEGTSGTQGTDETAGGEETTGSGESAGSEETVGSSATTGGGETVGSSVTTGGGEAAGSEETVGNGESAGSGESAGNGEAVGTESVAGTTEDTSEKQAAGDENAAAAKASSDTSSETAAEAEEQEENFNVGISLMSIAEEGEPVVTSNSSAISMTVELGGEELSGTNAGVTGWEYTDSKQLAITIDKEAGEACTVQIDLPMQVYATEYLAADGDTISSLEFVDLKDQTGFTDLSVYTSQTEYLSTATEYYKTYRVAGGVLGALPSGTWTYVIAASVTACTITMTLKYDASLWSNIAGSEVLTDGSAVTIAAYKGDTIDTGSSAEDTVSITSITSGTSTMSYTQTMNYKQGTSTSVSFDSTLPYLDQDSGSNEDVFVVNAGAGK